VHLRLVKLLEIPTSRYAHAADSAQDEECFRCLRVGEPD
jgi:hypothetical protein